MTTISNYNSLGFGATTKWNQPVSFSRTSGSSDKAALSNSAFLRQSCSGMKIAVGPRSHEDCPHGVTASQYSPSDSDGLSQAISAAYRQVFGNAHVMDFERAVELEAQLANGTLCVRDFVRGLAKTDLYKSRFFEAVAPQRGIELNIKHLLGRAPHSQSEVSACIAVLSERGHEAVVDHLVDSAEYAEVFGEDIVPYARSWSSPADLATSNFAHMAALEASFAISDSALGRASKLQRNLAANTVQRIGTPSQNFYGSSSGVAAYARGSFVLKPTRIGDGNDSTPVRNDAYVGFGLAQREQEVFQRCPGDSNDQIQALIRATYRQVMGNPHLMEFERSMSAESKYVDGFLSTREFVRAIGNSAEYKRRFFETNAPYRFIELNFKHFLGRAPKSQAEISEHIQILSDKGYDAEISSYVDCSEYQEIFGEDTVPYMRILSEQGRSQVAFNRHLSLTEGYAASDTVLTGSALVNSVATGMVPSGWTTTTSRVNRNSAQSGSPDQTTKRFRIVVAAQSARTRQRRSNNTYLVSGKDMSSQMKYIHARGGKILSITEVM